MSRTSVDSLSSDEAMRALAALFDGLPASAWLDEEKPSPLRVRKLVERLENEARFEHDAGPQSLAIVRALQTGASPEASAEAARWVLQLFHDQPEFATLTEEAILSAKKPHMSPVPPEAAYLLLGLLAMAFKFRRARKSEKTIVTKHGKEKVTTTDEFSFDLLKAVKEGLPRLSEFLPGRITSLFGKSHG